MDRFLARDIITDCGRVPLNPFAFDTQRDHDLVFLVVSDIHLDYKKLEKLKGWHKEYNNDMIDFVAVLGDFDNLPNSVNSEVGESERAKSEATITNILTFLEFLACPILFIPGNHDPATLFSSGQPGNDVIQRTTQHSFNLHRNVYQINPTLVIAGFGGSIPAYNNVSVGKKTEIWEGYPFNSDENLKKSSSDFLSSVFKQAADKKQQVILMTHVGPWSSSTTITRMNADQKEDIYSGSQFFDEVVFEAAKQKHSLVFLMHGHTHDANGKCNLGGIQIINPGSIIDGNFAKIALRKDLTTETWQIRQSTSISLNAF